MIETPRLKNVVIFIQTLLSLVLSKKNFREYQRKTTRINWDKGGIDQKGLLDNSEDLRNDIGFIPKKTRKIS